MRPQEVTHAGRESAASTAIPAGDFLCHNGSRSEWQEPTDCRIDDAPCEVCGRPGAQAHPQGIALCDACLPF